MNFQPAAGREIDKRRPAIIISPQSYNRGHGLCLTVPLTTNLTPGPFWIPMPPGLLAQPRLILCDYLKSYDYRERSAALIGRVTEELVEQIVEVVFDLIDPAA
jgi:mRNA interferase MazF